MPMEVVGKKPMAITKWEIVMTPFVPSAAWEAMETEHILRSIELSTRTLKTRKMDKADLPFAVAIAKLLLEAIEKQME